jgi:poly(3-hydroxybutyrate) depolymerase
MDADYYLDTIKTVFQEFKLVNGTWDVKSITGQLERVRPEDITTTAHFTVEGELDDISGSGQTEAAHGLCSGIPKSKQKHLEVKGAGHYGIFSGRRWRDIVYPQVKAFILENNKPVAPAGHAKTAPKKIAKPAARRSPVATPRAVAKKAAAKK